MHITFGPGAEQPDLGPPGECGDRWTVDGLPCQAAILTSMQRPGVVTADEPVAVRRINGPGGQLDLASSLPAPPLAGADDQLAGRGVGFGHAVVSRPDGLPVGLAATGDPVPA